MCQLSVTASMKSLEVLKEISEALGTSGRSCIALVKKIKKERRSELIILECSVSLVHFLYVTFLYWPLVFSARG